MDELTCRAEAIDILTRMSTNHFYGHREQKAFKLGAEALSAQRQGRWTDHSDEFDGGYYECSVCGEAFSFIEGTPKENNYRYCPNCGARMEE